MNDDLEWAKIRNEKPTTFQTARSGALRVTLLFGGLAIALGLVAVPLLDRGPNNSNFASFNNNLDPMTTASTRRPQAQTYTIRRSILQRSPSSKCFISANGQFSGDC